MSLRIVGEREMTCILTFSRLALIVDLVIDSMFRLFFLLAQKVSNELDGLPSNDQGSGNSSLAAQDQSEAIVSSGLLVFVRVDVENVVLALKAFVQREEHEPLGVCVQFVGGLLDNRKFLVDFGKCFIAQVVRFLEIWLEVLVRAGQVGQDGNGKRLVGGVAQLN